MAIATALLPERANFLQIYYLMCLDEDDRARHTTTSSTTSTFRIPDLSTIFIMDCMRAVSHGWHVAAIAGGLEGNLPPGKEKTTPCHGGGDGGGTGVGGMASGVGGGATGMAVEDAAGGKGGEGGGGSEMGRPRRHIMPPKRYKCDEEDDDPEGRPPHARQRGGGGGRGHPAGAAAEGLKPRKYPKPPQVSPPRHEHLDILRRQQAIFQEAKELYHEARGDDAPLPGQQADPARHLDSQMMAYLANTYITNLKEHVKRTILQKGTAVLRNIYRESCPDLGRARANRLAQQLMDNLALGELDLEAMDEDGLPIYQQVSQAEKPTGGRPEEVTEFENEVKALLQEGFHGKLRLIRRLHEELRQRKQRTMTLVPMCSHDARHVTMDNMSMHHKLLHLGLLNQPPTQKEVKANNPSKYWMEGIFNMGPKGVPYKYFPENPTANTRHFNFVLLTDGLVVTLITYRWVAVPLVPSTTKDKKEWGEKKRAARRGGCARMEPSAGRISSAPQTPDPAP